MVISVFVTVDDQSNMQWSTSLEVVHGGKQVSVSEYEFLARRLAAGVTKRSQSFNILCHHKTCREAL